VEFNDATLRDVEADANFDGGMSKGIANTFRKRMQQIRSALDERDFYALKSLRFEKLEGKRQHQRSMRLNDQWRLIIEITGEAPKKRILVISVEDYH